MRKVEDETPSGTMAHYKRPYPLWGIAVWTSTTEMGWVSFLLHQDLRQETSDR